MGRAVDTISATFSAPVIPEVFFRSSICLVLLRARSTATLSSSNNGKVHYIQHLPSPHTHTHTQWPTFSYNRLDILHLNERFFLIIVMTMAYPPTSVISGQGLIPSPFSFVQRDQVISLLSILQYLPRIVAMDTTPTLRTVFFTFFFFLGFLNLTFKQNMTVRVTTHEMCTWTGGHTISSSV